MYDNKFTSNIRDWYTDIQIPQEEYDECEELSISRKIPDSAFIGKIFISTKNPAFGEIEKTLLELHSFDTTILMDVLKKSSKLELLPGKTANDLIDKILMYLFRNGITLQEGPKNSFRTAIKELTNEPMLYSRIEGKIRGSIMVALKKSFADMAVIKRIDINKFVKDIIDDFYKVNYNSQQYDEIVMETSDKVFTAKTKGTSRQQIIPAPKERESSVKCPREIVEDLINSLTYISAKEKLKIKFSESGLTVLINGKVYPKSIFTKVLNDLSNQYLNNAINNCNMFLINAERIFYDQLNRKHKLYIDDSHILGIEATQQFIKKLVDLNVVPEEKEETKVDEKKKVATKDNVDDSKKEVETKQEKSHTQQMADNWLNLQIAKNKIHRDRVTKGLSLLQLEEFFSKDMKNIYKKKLKPLVETLDKLDTNGTIDEQIKLSFKLQNQITEQMIDRNEKTQIELLLYKIVEYKIKNGNHNTDSKEFDYQERIKKMVFSVTIEDIKNIFSENNYYFDKEFVNKVLSRENMIKEITSRFNNKKHIIEIYEKYKYIEEIQTILNQFYEVISYRIIIEEKDEKWENYFGNKHQDGIAQDTKVGPFAIAKIFIESELEQIRNFQPKDNNDILITLNIFKVLDKVMYLNNFNYSTDITRLFITDNQNHKKTGIICEMNAIYEILMAYFSQINEFKTAEFYSIQNVENLTTFTSNQSIIPELMDFNQKEYTTIISLEFAKTQNIITQNHNDLKKSKLSEEELICKLKSQEINLRYATSLEIKEDQTNKIFNFLQVYQRKNNSSEFWTTEQMIDLNLIGCSNIINWLENLKYTDKKSREEFEEFCGVTISSKSNFNKIKTILYEKILNYICNLIDSKMKCIDEKIDAIEHAKSEYFRLSWDKTPNQYKQEAADKYDEEKIRHFKAKKYLEDYKRTYLISSYQIFKILNGENLYIDPSQKNQEDSVAKREYIQSRVREILQQLPSYIKEVLAENIINKLKNNIEHAFESEFNQQVFIELLFESKLTRFKENYQQMTAEIIVLNQEFSMKNLNSKTKTAFIEYNEMKKSIIENFRNKNINPLLNTIDVLNISESDKTKCKMELEKKLYQITKQQYSFIECLPLTTFRYEVMRDINEVFEREKRLLINVFDGSHTAEGFDYETMKESFLECLSEKLNIIVDYLNSIAQEGLQYGSIEDIKNIFIEDILQILKEYNQITEFYNQENISEFIINSLNQNINIIK